MSMDGFAGTAVFCAEEYAQNWIIDNPIQYQARYDCESLLKCFYIMIKPKLRLKFKKQLNPNQKLQSVITAWKETADLDPKFKSYLFQIAQGTANPYQVLKDFVNFYLENGDAEIGDADNSDDEMVD
ncbi:hypothetical protein C9374_005989 [Naegleria lovaniensis]|uniref:Uncharacterized protein n=1 Tax=Naegleria lovaniensis TaxID=51637 RepID=A0AA88G4W4_NAELO|nr:uncharacterized protein C9374_014206 [Naegleria lovaniensis]XP_044547285.1 uncharacterized protein C9374_005989 [Naegleria lovaniensis]KAG2370791.1 hypothetical protein C9374_014206 [Naegleria lovaniensis]KAG2381605.1 hypothetical protein C9374_005989 [Naegleria lovaniensis]